MLSLGGLKEEEEDIQQTFHSPFLTVTFYMAASDPGNVATRNPTFTACSQKFALVYL
jgi:hypothetical protein